MNNENDIDLLADAQHEADLSAKTDSDKLDTLKGHAKRQVELEDEIEALGKQMADRQKELNELRVKTLPLAFAALQLTSIGVGNTLVRVETGVDARLPNEDKEPEKRKKAMQWLVDNKHSGVIKVYMECQFGKGDFDLAMTISEYIKKKYKLPVVVSESVHAATYKALMRDLLLTKNEIVPEEDLGVFRYTYSVVDRPEMEKPKRASTKKAKA